MSTTQTNAVKVGRQPLHVAVSSILLLLLLAACSRATPPEVTVDPESYLPSHAIEEDTDYLRPLALTDVIRINAGGPAVSTGGVSWQGDQFFAGGMAYSNSNVGDIANTDDDVLYVTERAAGSNLGTFSYAIPVPEDGTYEVRLHFAEIYWGAPGGADGGVGSRVFSAILEGGAATLVDYDIYAEVGPAAAVIKTYTVAVTDGVLDIDFSASVNRPKISAIEVTLVDGEEPPPPPPPPPPEEGIRINAGGPAVTTSGIEWLGDQHFVGGSAYANPNVGDIANTDDDILFVTERSASSNLGTFAYEVPVPAAGIYEVRLHFAEIFWGAPGGADGGVGSRVFSANIENGAAQLIDYDIYADVGPAAAVVKTYEVTVLDGALSLDFSATVNRPKLSALEIFLVEEVEGLRPSVTATQPPDGATDVDRDIAVVADLYFPNPGGVDGTSLSTSSVRLYRSADEAAVPGTVNTSGGNDSLVYQPSVLLDANTQYTFEVTEQVKDETGEPFEPFSMSFTTGAETGTTIDPRVTFERVEVQCCDAIFALTIGPDGKLYAAGLDGVLRRWQINANGLLVGKQEYRGLEGRVVIGMVFDPNDDRNLFLWTTDNASLIRGEPAEDFTGKITKLRLRGINAFEADMQDYVVGLPRSTKDHMTNNLTFGPDGFLYVSQGSNTGLGAPDSAWGHRPERLLTAAILRVDPKVPASQLPINVQTEPYNGTSGSYDPYAPGAPVQLFATGVRNAYDLIWHSNGYLYTPINGGNAGGNTPGSPDGSVPALENVATQDDFLARVDMALFQAGEVQYFGHPNPLRGEYVLNGGNPTDGVDPFEVVSDGFHEGYPVGVQPDPNFRGFVWNFGRNRSANGIIEYQSATFGGALQNKLLVVEYSAGKRILALELDANGDVNPSGVTQVMDGFANGPLDLVEDPRNGNLYIAEYPQFRDTGRIWLLRANDGVSTNHPPVVDAGEDQHIVWPENEVTLSGTASDPDGDALTTTWSSAIAPGDVTFSDASALTTTATFSGPGTYVLELTADDGQLTTSDQVTIEVEATDAENQPPLVDAGPDLQITWPTNSVSLQGSASDPDGDDLTTSWSALSGYGEVSFDDPSSLTAIATFAAPGTYVLELSASDWELTSADTMTVVVNGSSAPFTEIGWSEAAAAPLARTEAQGAAVGGRLYVFGGYVSWDPFCTTTAGHVYDPTSDSWSTLPDMPVAWTHAGAVVDGPTIFFAGGYLNEPNCNRTESATSTVWAYDTTTQGWSSSRIPPLPEARGSGGFAKLGRNLHFFGGTDTVRNDLGDHWAISLDGNSSWEPRAPIPNPRSHLAAVEFGGKIYAIGGQHGHESHLVTQHDVHVYDPETDSWSSAASLPLPVSHTVASTFVVENRILVLGGEQGFGPSNHLATVFAYEPASDTWAELTPLPAARNAAVGGVIDDVLYLTGGSTFTINTFRGVPGAASANQPPVVDAGPDQAITWPTATVQLSGSASDPDGDPLTTSWSTVSGTGSVTFGDASALSTTATFSEPGYYLLRLTASDGSLSSSDDVTITVHPSDPGETAGAWYALAPSGKPRQEVSYVEVGGKFYLAGGDTLHEMYDPVADSWSTVAPLPENLDHIQGAAVGGLIYYIGGLSSWPGPHSHDVYIYDPSSDSFSTGTPMPRGRGAGGVAVHDGKIYYAGGLHGHHGDTAVAVNWFDVYDPAADSWTELPDMPTARDHFHATVVDGKFYAIGGRDVAINAVTPVVEVYDFATGSWTTRDTQLPTPRGGFAAAVLGQEILIIGGEGPGGPFDGTFDVVEAYHTVGNTWRTLAPMATARHGIQAVMCEGGVYIAAGGLRAGRGPTDVHDVFFLDGFVPCDPDPVEPPPVNEAPVVDAGEDRVIVWPEDSVTLHATASDDGLPDPPGVLSFSWSQVSGPSGVVFSDASSLETVATFPEVGSYVLRFTADDGALSSSDDVMVTVEPEPDPDPPVNEAPVVDAGEDRVIVLPEDTVTLHATASDDGLPDPPGALTYSWTLVSGPGNATVTFSDPTTLETTATFSRHGTFTLRFTASDGELSSSDEVTIVVEHGRNR